MKFNPTIKNTLQSTAITSATSFIGAFALFLFGVNFFAAFILFFVLQFILFSFFGSIFKHYLSEGRKKLELDKLENLSTLLDCAYCKKQNVMIFNPDQSERIEFVCDHCKNKNLVSMQFVVAQISQPLENPTVQGIPVEMNDIIDNDSYKND